LSYQEIHTLFNLVQMGLARCHKGKGKTGQGSGHINANNLWHSRDGSCP